MPGICKAIYLRCTPAQTNNKLNNYRCQNKNKPTFAACIGSAAVHNTTIPTLHLTSINTMQGDVSQPM